MTVELTDVEDGEDVKVTQRMAVDALMAYDHASQMIKKMTNEKASISKAILKPYLLDHEGEEALYDGESGLEASLTPHSAPRWLDYYAIAPALVIWALEHDMLKINLAAVDAATEAGQDNQEFIHLKARIKPGGTGEPRLSVSKRDDT